MGEGLGSFDQQDYRPEVDPVRSAHNMSFPSLCIDLEKIDRFHSMVAADLGERCDLTRHFACRMSPLEEVIPKMIAERGKSLGFERIECSDLGDFAYGQIQINIARP